MKKVFVLFVLSFIFVILNSFVFADNTNEQNDVNELFEKYYHDGVYTKETSINLNDEALVEAIKYFHNQYYTNITIKFS